MTYGLNPQKKVNSYQNLSVKRGATVPSKSDGHGWMNTTCLADEMRNQARTETNYINHTQLRVPATLQGVLN